MSNIIETIQISGFDAEGAPEIHIHEDKTILLEFSFMPPSDVETEEDEAIYEDFDEQIEAAIGTPVIWEDRERFIIESPAENTVELLQKFLATYRANKAQQ